MGVGPMNLVITNFAGRFSTSVCCVFRSEMCRECKTLCAYCLCRVSSVPCENSFLLEVQLAGFLLPLCAFTISHTEEKEND